MENVRLNLTENENVAFINADGNDYKSFSMNENSIDEMIKKEKARKFNNDLDKFQESMNEKNKELEDSQNEVGYDVEKAEILPLFRRLLVKPFKQNPFQKIEMSGGIITNAGGYTPHTQLNPITGKYEEQDQFIRAGLIVEVGPETKYLKEGDVVYYRKDTAVPVPFLNWGLISIDESQIIATVNVNLKDRFNKILEK